MDPGVNSTVQAHAWVFPPLESSQERSQSQRLPGDPAETQEVPSEAHESQSLGDTHLESALWNCCLLMPLFQTESMAFPPQLNPIFHGIKSESLKEAAPVSQRLLGGFFHTSFSKALWYPAVGIPFIPWISLNIHSWSFNQKKQKFIILFIFYFIQFIFPPPEGQVGTRQIFHDLPVGGFFFGRAEPTFGILG